MLPMPNCPPGIKKKNAWIVYTEENGRINDLQVFELDEKYPDRWEKTTSYVDMVTRNKQIQYFDFGRVCSDWNQWQLADVIFKLGIQYGFKDKETAIYCLMNLSSIEEFKKPIEDWMQFMK